MRAGKKTSRMTAAVAAFMALLLASGGLAAAAGGRFIYDSKGRRSPFSPPLVEGHGKEEDISDDQEAIDRIHGMLTGVLWDEKKPIAFMVGAENEVVEQGDVIEGWRIVDITRKGIVIQKGERVVDLPIHEDE